MISIIIPSRDRPIGLLRVIASVLLTTKDYDVEIIPVLDVPDKGSHELLKYLPGLKIVTMSSSYINGHPQQKFQAGYKASTGEWVVTGSDDITFERGWLEAALTHPNKGFVGLWEEHHKEKLAILFMVTRNYVETAMNGRLGLTWYYAKWLDNEWKARAEQRGAFTVCAKAKFVHHHARYVGKMDDIARLGEQHYAQDKKTFLDRRRAGFPEKWPEAK
jgi:glycosyltransferase involved in cell wall biosynthesis